MRSTYIAKESEVERKWWVVDAADQALGRLASEVAAILRGKMKPDFTPHFDTGDFVIVINADKVVLTGNKLQQKMYNRHSGYPGGFRATNYDTLMKNKPEFVIEKAVKGMLPHTRLGRAQGKKVKVYRGGEHPHAAQLPGVWTLRG
ncbi:MAG: 50S ribosomal protein L13 [Firmicutes bacterium]|nr:50S ribosomal protein L13 [Bacillota bacterium]